MIADDPGGAGLARPGQWKKSQEWEKCKQWYTFDWDKTFEMGLDPALKDKDPICEKEK